MLKIFVLLTLLLTILLINPHSTSAYLSSVNVHSGFLSKSSSLLYKRALFSSKPETDQPPPSSPPVISTEVPEKQETEEQRLRREKLEEIEDLRSREVFVTRDTGRYECQSCGYVYDVAKGYPDRGIVPGTPWDDIEKFRCPECGAKKNYFVSETETISGFKENLKYGFGTNALTGGQKNFLIFGGLFLTFILFMSGYLLE